MGDYGTFKIDSIHGRLFELQVYIDSMKYHMTVYFAMVIIALFFWPIAALLALPVSMIAGKDKELQMFKVILVLATVIGIVLWTIPAFIVFGGSGIEHIKELIYVKKELNFLDLVDFFLSEMMILLTIVFAWVYHEICIDTEKYKNSQKASWKESRGVLGHDVIFPKAQLHRLRDVLKKEEEPREKPLGGQQDSCLTKEQLSTLMSPSASEKNDEEGSMPIEDVVEVLEALPGWEQKCLDVNDHLSTHIGEDMGLFADLAKLSSESKQKSIWPLDIWLTRTQFYPDIEIGLMVGLNVSFHYTKDLLAIIYDYVTQSYLATAVFIVLALVRTMLPRLWLWLVLDGALWPTDVYGTGGQLVLYSSCLTFLVSLVWMGLFYLILMEYRRTLCQMTIISALVDARMRVKFSQSYLLSCFWFGMDADQSEAVLAKLPLIDLRLSSNAAAFWRLREYCTLDRCNERMSVSVLLEIIIIWLLLKFGTTLGVMYMYAGLPAILIVTLFDLVVFGAMALVALQIALAMNTMMEQHKQSFVEAKYEVTMAAGRIRKEEKPDEKKQHDLEISRRLLTEYLDMTNESDTDARDSILFGMVVTPAKIISSLGTMSAMVGTLLAKMISNGSVKAPKALEKQLAAVAVHTVSAAATSFLSVYRHAWHVD